MWLNYKKMEVFHVIYKNKIQSLRFVHIPNFWLIWHNVSLCEKKNKSNDEKTIPVSLPDGRVLQVQSGFAMNFCFLHLQEVGEAKPSVSCEAPQPSRPHQSCPTGSTELSNKTRLELALPRVQKPKAWTSNHGRPVNPSESNQWMIWPISFHICSGGFPSSGSPLKAAGPAGHPILTVPSPPNRNVARQHFQMALSMKAQLFRCFVGPFPRTGLLGFFATAQAGLGRESWLFFQTPLHFPLFLFFPPPCISVLTKQLESSFFLLREQKKDWKLAL